MKWNEISRKKACEPTNGRNHVGRWCGELVQEDVCGETTSHGSLMVEPRVCEWLGTSPWTYGDMVWLLTLAELTPRKGCRGVWYSVQKSHSMAEMRTQAQRLGNQRTERQVQQVSHDDSRVNVEE